MPSGICKNIIYASPFYNLICENTENFLLTYIRIYIKIFCNASYKKCYSNIMKVMNEIIMYHCVKYNDSGNPLLLYIKYIFAQPTPVKKMYHAIKIVVKNCIV